MTSPLTGADGTYALGTTTSETSAANAMSGLDSDAFLKLLVAQLRYQNPMAPSDGTAMLEQTAMFTQVETLQQIADVQDELIQMQRVGVATGLVGRDVSIVTSDGTTVSGTVTSAAFGSGGPVLTVDGTEVPLANAQEIRHNDTTTDDTTTDDTTETTV